MIDQIEIKKPQPKTAYREVMPLKLHTELGSKRSEAGHAEVKIIAKNEDFEALEQGWIDLARESDTHIFQTFEWNKIWWKHFGSNRKLHIVAVYLGNKLVGIAPLFEDDVTLFGRKVYSCLRFLGSYVSQPEGEPLIGSISYSDYLDCIIQPGYEQLFYLFILQHFNEINSNFDEIILDEVSEESGACKTMIPLLDVRKNGLSYKIKQASSSPVIQLDSTWESFLKSMNAKERHSVRRYYNRSVKGETMAFKIEKTKHAEELPEILVDLIRMHQQQWNKRGFAGTFSEKRMRDFFVEIAKKFFEKDWIEINKAVPVEKNIKYVALDVFMTYKNRVYLMHRGMDENPLYKKQGPGNVLLFSRLNEAIKDGVKVFDMLRGSEDFKLRIATKINQNKKIVVTSRYNSEKLFPRLVKGYMKIIKHVRIEELHLIIVFDGKSFLRGITDYVQFLYRRIKHKLY